MNDPAGQTDRTLFDAVTAGDARALAELAGRHARGLYDFALRGTLDERQAAHVLTTVFQRAQAPQSQVPPQIDPRTWLYSLCLVEVLAVANETRTARVSTEDMRFFVPTGGINPDIAHWAWQAARGLRTRDYCVLDLTLRRGLTPEEVAEAASLTRSNLYASIGRARGAFEESFAAMLLYEYGRNACPNLDDMIDGAEGDSLRPALRHQIIEHADDCDACRRTLDSLPPAATSYISLADVEVPDALAMRVLGGDPVAAADDAAPPATTLSTAFAAGAAALEAGRHQEELWAEPEPVASSGPAAVEPPAGALAPEPPEVHESATEEAPVAEEPTATAEPPVAQEPASQAPPYSSVPDDEIEAPEEEPEPEQEPEENVETTAPLLQPRREPVRPASPARPAPGEERAYQPAVPLKERIATFVGGAQGQPLLWTYILLGVAAVLAVYLGFAVADALQSGGRDSGAIPLDAQADTAAAREIDCGDTPIELEAGALPTLISFEEDALDGYQIESLAVSPVSDLAEPQDIEATLEDPYTIQFTAAAQETTELRTEEFELSIRWERGEELASSTCQLLLKVSP